MERLNEATGSSMAQMNAALTDAITRMGAAGQASTERITKLVADLSDRIGSANSATLASTSENLKLVTDQLIAKMDKFSEQIAQTVGRNAQATHASVRKILDETNELSRQNVERMGVVLDRSQQQLERTAIMGAELDRLAEQLRAALPEYAAVSKNLQSVATDTNTAAQRSKDAANSIEETARVLRAVQGQVSEIAKHSADQVASVMAAVNQTRESMTDYQRVFAEAKTQAAELLEQVDARLRQQIAVSRDGYEAMSNAAGELFTQAAKRLGSTVESLNDSLDTLEGAIERLGTMSNGRVSR